MAEILTQQAGQLQNVYTPLPLTAHFVFCIIATIVYLVQFYRKGSYHYLLMMAAVDATIITQFRTTPAAIAGLAICEAVLLVCAAVLSFRYNKALKKLHEKEDCEAKKAEEIEKAQAEKDKKLVDNAFDDE